MKMYLIGTYYTCNDCSGFPNTREFPQYCTDNLEEAERKYAELASNNCYNSMEAREAYLVEAATEGFSLIKGGREFTERNFR